MLPPALFMPAAVEGGIAMPPPNAVGTVSNPIVCDLGIPLDAASCDNNVGVPGGSSFTGVTACEAFRSPVGTLSGSVRERFSGGGGGGGACGPDEEPGGGVDDVGVGTRYRLLLDRDRLEPALEKKPGRLALRD